MSRIAVVYEGPVPERSAALAALPDGVEVLESFADAEGSGGDGLTRALETIASGQASTLCVQRLEWVASSLGEFLALIHWLDEAGGSLLAADVELDTAAGAGRRSVALLREIDRWGREGHRPRGRPGLKSGSPELAERIAGLRSSGLSLQAIADRLNADHIPTPRGGASWRPSSVQSALGYRRPRPPAPGVPPPHSPPPHSQPPHSQPPHSQPPPPPPRGKRPRPSGPPKPPGRPGPRGPGHR